MVARIMMLRRVQLILVAEAAVVLSTTIIIQEHQADPAWGMALTPAYRQMILKGDLVPVGQLSAAFLAPKTPQHLQFAYLQSSLVVDFLVGRFGREALRGLLLAGAGSAPMRCANAAYFDGLRARVRNAAQTATEN